MPNETLAEQLNRSCHCISVDSAALQKSLESAFGEPGSYARLRETHPTLFADSPVFVSREHIAGMQSVIEAVEHVVALGPYQEQVLGWAPDIASRDGGPHGVFLGFDFHLTQQGPRLIEINTNAGGGLLLLHVAVAQQACCVEVREVFPGEKDLIRVEAALIEMFRNELRTVRPQGQLRRVAIVDDEPQSQFLSPEFGLFRQMFMDHGIDAIIADPRDLELADDQLLANGKPVDLVYNRLTDFYLQSAACATLRKAHETRAVVLTPTPRTHALYANKANLTVFCDADALRRMGAERRFIETLSTAVPRTVRVNEADADELWAHRRQLFFKPAHGFGSRGTYKGAKLTKKTWSSILQAEYVAQELIPPSERLVITDGADRSMKVDVRCYVYRGEVQLLGARLYQGQTTNFRTGGGGLAAVFTTP